MTNTQNENTNDTRTFDQILGDFMQSERTTPEQIFDAIERIRLADDKLKADGKPHA
jgi:hypothetical protein